MSTVIKSLLIIASILFSSASFANKQDLKSEQTAIVNANRVKLLKLSKFVQENEMFTKLREKNKKSALSVDERTILREAWAQLLNSHLELNSVIKTVDEDNYQTISKEDAFAISYASFLVQYRSAIDFIRALKKIPSADLVLNEPVKELGLEEKMFAKFKFEYLNLAKFAEYSEYRLESKTVKSVLENLKEGIDEDKTIISNFNKYKGFIYTMKNAGKMTSRAAFKTYFPVQKNISEWMGDERVARGDKFLINEEQIKAVHKKLKAGDVLIERREWYLSNIGLPGFWPHSALFIGRPEERIEFQNDEEVKQWVREEGVLSGNFEHLLSLKYPQAYEESLTNDKEGHPFSVLEAMSEGVVFTSLEHSAYADSLAVIRPKLSNLDVAKGILAAFKYKGRPYDFNFDFRTDSQVVCSELIYYAYQKTSNKNGLEFPMTMTVGRPVITPNNIIKDLSENYGTDKQQFDFVLFLDGNDKKREAVFSDMENLKSSWNRPKWFIFTQD